MDLAVSFPLPRLHFVLIDLPDVGQEVMDALIDRNKHDIILLSRKVYFELLFSLTLVLILSGCSRHATRPWSEMGHDKLRRCRAASRNPARRSHRALLHRQLPGPQRHGAKDIDAGAKTVFDDY